MSLSYKYLFNRYKEKYENELYFYLQLNCIKKQQNILIKKSTIYLLERVV